jgi:hypothetical protein
METVAIDWTYAISTLIIRFVGIFVVLGVLQVIMQITGRIFLRLDEREAAQATIPEAKGPAGMTEEQAAAVGMALYLHDQRR